MHGRGNTLPPASRARRCCRRGKRSNRASAAPKGSSSGGSTSIRVSASRFVSGYPAPAPMLHVVAHHSRGRPIELTFRFTRPEAPTDLVPAKGVLVPAREVRAQRRLTHDRPRSPRAARVPRAPNPNPCKSRRRRAPFVSSISHPSPRLITVQSSGGRLNSPLEPAGKTRNDRCAASGMSDSVTENSSRRTSSVRWCPSVQGRCSQRPHPVSICHVGRRTATPPSQTHRGRPAARHGYRPRLPPPPSLQA